MTGPEHYRRAEEYLSGEYRGGFGVTSGHVNVARGIGHALLALAAATALQDGADEMYASDKSAWVAAASEEEKVFP